MAIPNYIPLFGNRVGISSAAPTRLVLDGVEQPGLDLAGGWAVDARAGVSGAVALNIDLTRAFSLTFTGDAALSFTSSLAGQPVCLSVVLQIVQGAGGNHLVTWPEAVKWSGNYAPSLLTVAGGKDAFQLLSFDGGLTFGAGRILQIG